MALVFCCPECGATLRATRSAAVAVIACIGCGEAVRVPCNAHPAESAIDTPTIRSVDAERARRGLTRLVRSLALFALSCLAILAVLSLWIAVGTRQILPAPIWLTPTVVALVLVWLTLTWAGSIYRIRGYHDCEAAAATVAVDGWTRLAAFGALLTAAGQFSVVMLFLTRSPQLLPAEVTPFAMAGMLAGAVGTAMEFGFITTLHRLLWESSGWQAARRTGQFAVTFIFAAIASMGVVLVGFLALSNLHAQDPEGLATARQTRLVFAGMLSALASLVLLVCFRYVRLLRATQRALLQPQPYLIEKLPAA